ncbi:uncharacterized protein LOC133560608 [Nerophis ophidion]|uniref:uncharacterized protein LOC133560608 n=1 Tax=Nerophis ophidion TaxID=159077 RepID=UPI002ADF8927|nr:uncharacterized protein LOC133560608 [Nerophis ophidion]
MSTPTPLEALGQVLSEVSAASRQQTKVVPVLMGRADAAGGSTSMKRMVEGEDPQTFLEVFEATAAACKWLEEEWGARLLPLLAGEAQRAALSLPASARTQYTNQRHAILNRVGSSPKDHRRQFRAMKLASEGQPFIFSHRLRDAATKWLQPNGQDTKMLEEVVLEQFLDGIPARTSAWVRYHSPPVVQTAVRLVEEHLAVHREATPTTARKTPPTHRRQLAPRWGGASQERRGGPWPDYRRPASRFPTQTSINTTHTDIYIIGGLTEK